MRVRLAAHVGDQLLEDRRLQVVAEVAASFLSSDTDNSCVLLTFFSSPSKPPFLSSSRTFALRAASSAENWDSEAELCILNVFYSSRNTDVDASSAGAGVGVVREEHSLGDTVDATHPVDHRILQLRHHRVAVLQHAFFFFCSVSNPSEADDAEERDERLGEDVGQRVADGDVAVEARVLPVVELQVSSHDDGSRQTPGTMILRMSFMMASKLSGVSGAWLGISWKMSPGLIAKAPSSSFFLFQLTRCDGKLADVVVVPVNEVDDFVHVACEIVLRHW